MTRNKEKRKTLLRDFLRLMLVLLMIVSVITVLAFQYAAETIRLEFRTINLAAARNLRLSMESLMRQMRLTMASILVDDRVRFFFSDSAQAVFPDVGEAASAVVRSHLNVLPSLDSIYVYAPETGQVAGAYGVKQLAALNDLSWLPYVRERCETRIVPLQKTEGYPYVLSVMRRADVQGADGAVVVNINLQRLPGALSVYEDTTQSFYVLTGDGQVLYRRDKQNLLEDLSICPELIHFEAGAGERTLLWEETDTPYAWAQVYDANLDMYFVAVTHLQEYTVRMSGLRGMLFSVVGVAVAGCMLIAAYFSARAFRPLKRLEEALDSRMPAADDRRFDRYTQYLAARIVANVQSNAELKTALDERLHLLEHTQLKALQAQINPHFLFNTLNAISVYTSAALGDDHPAPNMAVWLSEMLRYALEETDLVPLRRELAHTKTYLKILGVRYGEEFSVRWAVEDGLSDTLLPKLILQPIVENAVFHGMLPSARFAPLSIAATREGENLALTVRDEGEGMTPEQLAELCARLESPRELPGRHIGLMNVAMRLHITYPDAPPIQIESEAGRGTTVIIRLPL